MARKPKWTKKEIFLLNKNLRIENLLNDIAHSFAKSFIDGIEKTSTDIDGQPFEKLTSNTIELKKEAGYSNPEKPLWAEGIMKEVYLKERATQARPVAKITVPKKKDRQTVAVKHITGDKVKKREWFGVGKVQEEIGKKTARLHLKSALMKKKKGGKWKPSRY